MTDSPVALITGASSGIGEATARRLHESGFAVYAVARRLERMAHLAELGIRTHPMDVTDEESMTAGVARLLAEQGRVDVLINNAGYGSYGALEEVPLDEARAQMEVNVFGAARLTQLVLPQMRAQRSGRIINVTSMAGRMSMPLGSWYHATKFAMEAISDSLRMEVEGFGIDVVIVEPGSIKTEWGDIAAENALAVSGDGPYAAQAHAVANSLTSQDLGRFASSPDLIARTITKAATVARPRTRYAVGLGAKPLIAAHTVLPDRTFDAVVRGVLRVPKS